MGCSLNNRHLKNSVKKVSVKKATREKERTIRHYKGLEKKKTSVFNKCLKGESIEYHFVM